MRFYKMTQTLFPLFILSIFLAGMIYPSQAASKPAYSKGDFVEYDIEVNLKGKTKSYSSYKETETENRRYTILDMGPSEIYWQMERDFLLTSNEGERLTDKKIYTFVTDSNTLAYLGDTHDGPVSSLDYYTYDYIWFRIDPTISQGDTILIMGDPYLVEAKGTDIWFQGTFVNAIKLVSTNTSDQFVNNRDYNPYGPLRYTYEETYYYDTETGYLLKSEWNAKAYTNVGDFEWKETIVLSDSYFSTEPSTLGKVFYPAIGLLIFLMIISIFSYWQRDVDYTINVLNNRAPVHEEKSFWKRRKNRFKGALYSYRKVIDQPPMLWKPLELRYEDLLPKSTSTTNYVFKPGVYLVIDPKDRLGIVDVTKDKYVSPKLIRAKNRNISLLFKLALGTQPTLTTNLEKLIDNAVDAGIHNMPTKDRTAAEILFLCTTKRELKLYAKGFGWGRAFRQFEKHLLSMKPEDIVVSKVKVIPSLSKTILTKAKNIVKEGTKFAPSDSKIFNNITRFELVNDIPNLGEDYLMVKKLLSRRKVIDYSLGQAPLTPISHIRKLNHILEHSAEKVLMIGDDDLISISLARKGIEVTMLEIDPYTCALIAGIAQEEQLKIDIHQVDLRLPLPKEIPDDFDLFVADPDFTLNAFGLFLCRGLSKIKEGGIGLINFEGTLPQQWKIKKLLKAMQIETTKVQKEKWTYVSIYNHTSKTKTTSRRRYGYSRHGKYHGGVHATYHYHHGLYLGTAPYSSQMYVVRKTPTINIPLDHSVELQADNKSIYDF